MVGGRKSQSISMTSSMSAGWQLTSKPCKNCLLLQNNTSKHMTFQQWPNRLTWSVCYAITQHKYIDSMTPAVHNTITQHIRDGTTCSRALPIYHQGTLEVAPKTENSSSRDWTTLTMKEPRDSCHRSQATCGKMVRLTKVTAERNIDTAQ